MASSQTLRFLFICLKNTDVSGSEEPGVHLQSLSFTLTSFTFYSPSSTACHPPPCHICFPVVIFLSLLVVLQVSFGCNTRTFRLSQCHPGTQCWCHRDWRHRWVQVGWKLYPVAVYALMRFQYFVHQHYSEDRSNTENLHAVQFHWCHKQLAVFLVNKQREQYFSVGTPCVNKLTKTLARACVLLFP